MIENLEIDGRTVAVSSLSTEQQQLVSVLEKLNIEGQELQFAMAKVGALAEVVRKQLTESFANAPEAE